MSDEVRQINTWNILVEAPQLKWYGRVKRVGEERKTKHFLKFAWKEYLDVANLVLCGRIGLKG